MNNKYIIAVTTSMLLLSGVVASASTITINPSVEGTPWEVGKIEKWATTGNDMDGMSITAIFSNNESQTLYWKDGTGASEVGTGWSLTMDDYNVNTWWNTTHWNLANDGVRSIKQLVIDGKPGNTVFDIIFSDDSTVSTPDSERGQKIIEPEDYINPGLLVDATYSNRVKVKGSTGAWYDLYQTLTINFSRKDISGNELYFGSGERFVAALDTDNVGDPVPEPATMLMFGLGLTGLIGMRKRKDK